MMVSRDFEAIEAETLAVMPPGTMLIEVAFSAAGKIVFASAKVPGPWRSVPEDGEDPILMPHIVITAGLAVGVATPQAMAAAILTMLLRTTLPEVSEAMGYGPEVDVQRIEAMPVDDLSRDRAAPARGHDA